jgi:hypothetical protein
MVLRSPTPAAPDLASPSPRPAPCQGLTLVSMDVEWTKNYRVRGGNVPFCYSLVTITIPLGLQGHPLAAERLEFDFTSVYVEHAEETQRLIQHADADLDGALGHACYLAGHQLSSDLAVLTNAATGPLSAVARARTAWTTRRQSAVTGSKVVDTRYDTDQVLRCTSRRLVDVCTDLGLDVTQPELRGSMTAMHHTWLATHDPELRERLTVLNLRHSLSTALVALYTLGVVRWTPPFNVNQLLYQHLAGQWTWLDAPTFQRLL